MQRANRGRHRPKLIALAVGLGLSFLLALVPSLPGAAISPAEVPNPRQIGGTWVTDLADMLSPDSENALNQMISALEASNGTELAVVTVPDTQPSSSPKAFATELFEAWGIGKDGVDNGVLFLVSKGDRRTEVETGYGVEGLLSDAKVGKILDSRVTPQFKAGDFDAGILAGTEAIIISLKGEEFAPSQVTRQHSSNPLLPGASAANPTVEAIRNLFWLSVLAYFIVLTVRLRKLATRRPISLEIGPIDRSSTVELKTKSQQWKAGAICLLVGGRIAEAKGLTHDRSALLNRYSEPKVEGSWLVTVYQREQLVLRSGQLFGWFLALAGLFMLLTKDQVLVEPIFTFVWLCCELWFYAQDIQNQNLPKENGWHAAATRLAVIGLIGLSMAIAINLISEVWVAWLLLTAFFGTGAVLLRLVRSLPDQPEAICKTCREPMYRLSAENLNLHLSKPEQTEMQIKSKLYEGWQCDRCSLSADDNLSIHLASHVLNTKGYLLCTACNALTLKTTPRTDKSPTTQKTGKRTLSRLCHCCGGHSESKETIPKIVLQTSSSSSSSSSSSGSSSSSSSSSSGSFGGGNSGGGGAGSSW